MPYIDANKCNQCEECIFVCLNNAINFIAGEYVIDKLKCKSCNNCLSVCPIGAIKKSPEELKRRLVLNENSI